MGIVILVLILTGSGRFMIGNFHPLGFVIIYNFLSHFYTSYFSVIGFAFSLVVLARPWISGTGSTSFLEPWLISGRFIPFFANVITSRLVFHQNAFLLRNRFCKVKPSRSKINLPRWLISPDTGFSLYPNRSHKTSF